MMSSIPLALTLLTAFLFATHPSSAAEHFQWQRPANPDVAVDPNTGGSLVVQGGSSEHLPRIRYHVDVHIEDGFARTTIDQVYHNRSNRRLEGTYRFPIPENASISRLAMTVKGELIEGGMVEKKRAASIYNEIRNKRRDPVLLEWIDGRTFKMRVFPIEPKEYKRIIISYTQRLEEIDGDYHFRFPGANIQKTQQWSVKIRAINSASSQWNCKTHKLEARKVANDLILTSSKNNTLTANALSLKLEKNPVYPVRFEFFDSGKDRYAMIRWKPEIGIIPSPNSLQKRTWNVIFEASADRDPVFARQQIEALRELMNAFKEDHFRVLVTNTDVEILTGTDQLKQLDNVHLIGALDLTKAFESLSQTCYPSESNYIIHLGAGRPTLGPRRHQELVKFLPKNVPYIGIGIGPDVNTSLMGAAAERSGGLYSQLENGRELTRIAMQVISKHPEFKITSSESDSPFLIDADAAFMGGDLFAVARLKKGEPLPRSVTLHSTLAHGSWKRELTALWQKCNAGYLPRTWARMEIARLAPEGDTNRANIIQLSQQAFVMSPFTSLLVLESAAMHEEYGVDQSRGDHWAKYIDPVGKLADRPRPTAPRPAPTWEEPAPVEKPKRKKGFKEFEPKFPKPMFIGTPVQIRLANLERPRLPGSSNGPPKVWRPMFAGQIVALSEPMSLQATLEKVGRPRLTFHAPADTEFLSRDCKVTSSDEWPIIGDLEMITDGDKDGADGSYVELSPGRQWVQLDLGARSELWAVVLWHFHKNARAYLDVVAQVSDDPEFRFDVRTIYNNDHDNSSSLGLGDDKAWIETNHGRIIDVPGISARYLRFYSNGNTANEMNHYVEIEVYGQREAKPAVLPDHSTTWTEVSALQQKIEKEWQKQQQAAAVNLHWLRTSHAELLSTISYALADKPAPPGFNLEQRITHIADRWWGIDCASPDACLMAAALFGKLSRGDLQWQYLTTPIAVDGSTVSNWRTVRTFAKQRKMVALEELARRESLAARDNEEP